MAPTSRNAPAPGSARILVVDDDVLCRAEISESLSSLGVVDALSDGSAAVQRIGDPSAAPYDLVVTELRLPGDGGERVVAAARARTARTRVVVVSADGAVESVVRAMRLGATDFLQKPLSPSDLQHRVESVLAAPRRRGGSPATRQRVPASGVVTESRAMQDALRLVRRVAPTPSTVLITGETGTGKEIIAGLLHDLSERADGPFVKVNCAALPEPMLEAELFGHERGAFTGAEMRRIGRFEQADEGTLFLDEIGEMSASTQVKLLRVLQEREFHRLGGVETIRTDVRVIAATNRDLGAARAAGLFREDLYFRLAVVRIDLCPLRERPEDAVKLAQLFLTELSAQHRRPRKSLSAGALERIRTYSFPGNVRELRNAIERAVLLCDDSRIEAHHIAPSNDETRARAWAARLPEGGIPLRDVERELVLQALDRAGFVQKEAAELLHVSRRKLNYMIQRMGLTHPSWRRNRGPEPGVGDLSPVGDEPAAQQPGPIDV